MRPTMQYGRISKRLARLVLGLDHNLFGEGTMINIIKRGKQKARRSSGPFSHNGRGEPI